MGTEYKVLKISEMVRPGEVSGVDKFYRHTIRTKGGVILSVEIAEADFTPEKSGPILSAAAKNAEAILKL